MPVEDFINRTKNGYCIVCKTCRDRQLKRYYGRNSSGEESHFKKKRMNWTDIPTIMTKRIQRIRSSVCRRRNIESEGVYPITRFLL